MAGKSANSFGAKNWSPGPPSTRYNVSGKNHDFYTFENAPGSGAYATGGTIIDGGDGYIYHIFTGSGTFQVNRPPAAIDSVDYLIVAGGGGHGSAQPFGGGGGGGGFVFGNIGVSNAPGTYPITVGAGGPNSVPLPAPSGRSGSPSTAFGLTAAGGGGGGSAGPPAALSAGASGGSGGGANPVTPFGAAGTGNTPALIPRQGYNGGLSPSVSNGAGGGGAGGIGANGASGVSGTGGPGRISPEFPSTVVRRAIPAPVLPSWEPLVAPGGYAAGGQGSPVPAPSQRTTPANSGYGGNFVNSAGGSGIVCIRYKKTAAYQRATGGTIEPNTHPEHPGVWRHIFTSPGDFTITDPTLQWIDYLAVGGGGGGGGTAPSHGGGGGGGGFVSSIHTSPTTPAIISDAYPWNPGYSVLVGEQMPVGVGTYPIGIGTGGNAATAGNNTTIGVPGANQIIAYGGGAGATAPGNGGNGASGGGGAKPFPSAVAATGGTATPSPNTQGNAGNGTGTQPSTYAAGGGGGAGGSSSGPTVFPGGPGWYSVLSPSAYGTPGPLTPTSIYRYFGGGGGGVFSPGINPVAGGVGGGGAGNVSSPNSGTPGTTNTGGGGGGGFGGTGGGSGGPGIVIIQYPE
jgi:hypothetical protein